MILSIIGIDYVGAGRGGTFGTRRLDEVFRVIGIN